MFQYLPPGNFVEIGDTERNKCSFSKSILDTKDDHKLGYLIGCDLECPLRDIKTKAFFVV